MRQVNQNHMVRVAATNLRRRQDWIDKEDQCGSAERVQATLNRLQVRRSRTLFASPICVGILSSSDRNIC